ncbi:hypothetical protein EBT25_18450, partial [bacterium]|nr:hypothetical protein [bacterium]
NRGVLVSGSVVRVPVRTTQAGATTPQDFYVAEDPAARGNYGDSYLVLQPVTSISGVSYPYTAVINSYSADGGATTSYGLYNVSMNQLQLNLVETRTVSSIVNATTLTVTAAWSSTSNRSWASASSGFATRAFAINSVNSDTSLSLRSAAAATTSFNSIINTTITSTTTLADRRFSVVSITNNTTITVSGGGIYSATAGRTALFARPETTSGATAIEGYVISGDHDVSTLTANTTWVSSGLPGIDSTGVDRGTNLQTLTLNIGNSSFTVVRVINNTTVLVTGSVITNNFFDTSMVSQFPAGIDGGTVTGTGTKFAASSTLISGITRTTEEVTIFNNSDTRTGYLSVSGQLLRVVNIINNT